VNNLARRVELVVSSQSSCAVRLARHSQNAWARHVERVESSQVEFGLICLIRQERSPKGATSFPDRGSYECDQITVSLSLLCLVV